jgi:hypothetical protein
LAPTAVFLAIDVIVPGAPSPTPILSVRVFVPLGEELLDRSLDSSSRQQLNPCDAEVMIGGPDLLDLVLGDQAETGCVDIGETESTDSLSFSLPSKTPANDIQG